jgi:hypothetical protein
VGLVLWGGWDGDWFWLRGGSLLGSRCVEEEGAGLAELTLELGIQRGNYGQGDFRGGVERS